MVDTKVYPQTCPICSIDTNTALRIVSKEDGDSDWYFCTCGVVFQKDKPGHGHYDDKYIGQYAGAKEADLIQVHAAKTFAPIIEELTYGRKMLDVGFNLPQNMHFFRERGWVTTGLDINPTFKGESSILTGNFETYCEFKQEYDLIWMSHVFEHFDDPINALKKCRELLSETGVLYLSTPDIDFMSKTGTSNWPHWTKNEHYIMWNLRSLVRELERLDFNVVLKRRNYSSRFTSWFDIQLIAQKKYF